MGSSHVRPMEHPRMVVQLYLLLQQYHRRIILLALWVSAEANSAPRMPVRPLHKQLVLDTLEMQIMKVTMVQEAVRFYFPVLIHSPS